MLVIVVRIVSGALYSWSTLFLKPSVLVPELQIKDRKKGKARKESGKTKACRERRKATKQRAESISISFGIDLFFEYTHLFSSLQQVVPVSRFLTARCSVVCSRVSLAV